MTVGSDRASRFQEVQHVLVFAAGRAEGAVIAGAGRVGVGGRGGWQLMLATAQLAPGVTLVILFRISRLHNTCNLI